MMTFGKLPRLPRASGTKPGTVAPASWNALAERIEEIERRMGRLRPMDGPDFRVQESTSGFLLVPKRRGVSGGGSGTRAPWAPVFFTEGADPVVYKCRFNLGTVNDVAATNWNDAFTLPSDDTIKFVVLTVTSASGKVTGVTISVDASPPAEDDIAKDTPPVSFKILLGAIGKTSAQMIVTDNLTMLATEVFRESKVAPATGAEPFSRWWRWSVQ